MKRALTYLTLSTLLVAGLTTQVMADDNYDSNLPNDTTNVTNYYTVQLGTDADYNLDYDKNNGEDCEVNKQLELTPDQRSKLRGSRIRLQKQLSRANVTPEENANLQGQKVSAIRPILSDYQFRQYLILREQCN